MKPIWTINTLEVEPQRGQLADVVVTAHWSCGLVDGDHAASVYGAVALDAPAAGSFCPFANLEESQVIEWVKAKVGADATEAAVAAQLAERKSPKVIKPELPWNTSKAKPNKPK